MPGTSVRFVNWSYRESDVGEGYDAEGANQLRQQLLGTRKWIGTAGV